jgi:ferredoxin
MPAGFTVRVDRTRCVCSEYCARLAPSTFETDDEGLVHLLDNSDDSEISIRSAAASCPVNAITIEEQSTGKAS